MAPIPFLSSVFPPKAPFTDAHLSSLAGKVIIITGAASGVGYELAKILYLAGGTVYIAARSTSRCQDAVDKILAQTASAKGKMGKLKNMIVDLADLKTVRPAVDAFLKREKRLDVLVHNAGVMEPPKGSVTRDGHDLELGVNTLAPYLLTLLLSPILTSTATAPGTKSGDIRIIWVVSLIQWVGPEHMMNFDGDGVPVLKKGFMVNYMQSKVGETWLADHFAKCLGKDGILSVSLHPGLMRTELQRNSPFPMRLLMGIFLKPAIYGAYSELYASFSPEVTMVHNGGHLMAWGRNADLPESILAGQKSEKEGGTGNQARFLAYCDREVKTFL